MKGGWKCFDFGPDKKESNSAKANTVENSQKEKKHEVSSHRPRSKKPLYNFHNAIVPQKVTELAVHPKKIKEVEGWLKFTAFGKVQDKKNTSFLLLTGPAGSGKTTTVNVLCKSLGISVSEWINPMDLDYETFPGPGQVSRFSEFLADSKYISLFDSGCTNKVIIVKDFPNVFLRQPEEFFNVLGDCYYQTRFPVIFICTDASSSNINLSRILFPEEILLKYSFTHYTFNSCANTLLKNALKRADDIVKNRPDLFKQLSNSMIEAIVASSMGDIRCAMNQFYLASLIGCDDVPLKQPEKPKLGNKRKRSNSLGTVQTMTRDENLGLFHGVGRVLNPKRIETDGSWRLHCDVGKLVEEFSIQPSMFISFLFENYLEYFGDVSDVGKAIEILSYASTLLENWDRRDTLIIALWVSVLGLMVCNEHRVTKWNQIRGPKKITKSIAGTITETQLNSTDRFYYDLINKTSKYHKFKFDV